MAIPVGKVNNAVASSVVRLVVCLVLDVVVVMEFVAVETFAVRLMTAGSGSWGFGAVMISWYEDQADVFTRSGFNYLGVLYGNKKTQ